MRRRSRRAVRRGRRRMRNDPNHRVLHTNKPLTEDLQISLDYCWRGLSEGDRYRGFTAIVRYVYCALLPGLRIFCYVYCALLEAKLKLSFSLIYFIIIVQCTKPVTPCIGMEVFFCSCPNHIFRGASSVCAQLSQTPENMCLFSWWFQKLLNSCLSLNNRLYSKTYCTLSMFARCGLSYVFLASSCALKVCEGNHIDGKQGVLRPPSYFAYVLASSTQTNR